jgi:hypothetical protein
MRSKILDAVMKEGQWTNDRIHAQLRGVAHNYFLQVMSGNKCPSPALAMAIKNIVCHHRTKVKITELFPLLNKNLPANSISTEGASGNSKSRRAKNSKAPQPVRTGSTHVR